MSVDASNHLVSTDGPEAERIVLSIIVEAQLSGEGDLRWRLCPYVGFVSHDSCCATDVVILCGTSGLARTMARPVMLGARGSMIVPRAVGPADVPVITTSRDGLSDPGLLVLSAWYHTRRDGALRDTMVALLLEVIGTLSEIDPEQARRYHWLALEVLPAPTARRLKRMTMTMSDLVQHAMKKYYPEDYREFLREGRVADRAECILEVLDARGLDVPDDIREQIVGCQDLKRLRRWTKRAATAKTAAEVVAG